MCEKKPHKHAEVIKAWADGAEIEARCPAGQYNKWTLCTSIPSWYNDWEYRVKPPKKTPGEVCYEAWYSRTASGLSGGAYVAAKAVIEAYKRGEFDGV